MNPKVTTVEIDLSQRVPSFQGMYGLIIGGFRKGRVGERLFISNQQDADRILGRPIVGSDSAYHVLHSYLEKSQRCWVTRVAADDAVYGGIAVGSQYSALLGTGSGTIKQFTGTVAFGRCLPGTVSIYIDGDKVGYDNSSGVIQGTTLENTSTINYKTGAVSLDFSVPVPKGAKVYAHWGFPNVSFNAGKTDPESAAFNERDLTQEVAFSGLDYLDSLVPYPVISPNGEVTAVSEATVVLYDEDTVLGYFNEDGVGVDVATGFFDTEATNELNYATGTISFSVDAGYTLSGVVTAQYKSRLSDLFLLYADSPGMWSDDLRVVISRINEDRNTFKISVFEARENQPTIMVTSYETSLKYQVSGLEQQQYLEEMINGTNDYIRVFKNPYIDPDDVDVVLPIEAFVPAETLAHTDVLGSIVPIELTGGDDGTAVTVAKYITALETYNNKEDVPVDLVIDTLPNVTYHTAIMKFCDRAYGGRGDCYGILQVPFDLEQASDYAVQAINYRKYELQASSSFVGLYFGHVNRYDAYTGRNIWIPSTGHIAGIFSYTADQFKPWFAAAGWQRGRIATEDIYRKVTEGERDALYDADVNCFKSDPERGLAVWGQKTLYGQPSALDRANVRWCLIVVENAIEEYEESMLFELNDAYTRKLMSVTVADYLGRIKAERGIYDYRVVCDESNNTPEVIDNNEMYLDFYIQPVKAAEFIYSRAVITRTGAKFDNVRLISG